MFRRSFLVSVSALMACAATTAVRAEPPPREQTRIQKLIAYVENQKGMTFIRNGSEYTCEEAGKFLRGKMEAMGAVTRASSSPIRTSAGRVITLAMANRSSRSPSGRL